MEWLKTFNGLTGIKNPTIMFGKLLYLFKELHKQASEFSSKIRIMVDRTKFNSHDSGGHF